MRTKSILLTENRNQTTIPQEKMIPPPLILFSLSVELYGPYVYKLHRIRQEVCLAIYKSVNTISAEEAQAPLKLSRFTRNTRRVCQLIIEGHFSFFYPLGFLSSLLLLFGEQCHISCSPLNRSIVYLKVQDKSLHVYHQENTSSVTTITLISQQQWYGACFDKFSTKKKLN